MAKKIVRNAGIVAVAGAAVIGSNIPANAFAEVPAATTTAATSTITAATRPPQLPTLHLRLSSRPSMLHLRRPHRLRPLLHRHLLLQ